MATPNIADRFPSSVASAPPSPERVDNVRVMREATITLAEVIDELVPDGRDKSLALTHLEDALYRASRGVFAAPTPTSVTTEQPSRKGSGDLPGGSVGGLAGGAVSHVFVNAAPVLSAEEVAAHVRGISARADRVRQMYG